MKNPNKFAKTNCVISLQLDSAVKYPVLISLGLDMYNS